MGAEFRVNSYQNNWQYNPDIVTFADGGFLVVWDSYFNNYDDGPSTTYIAAQRYDASGRRVGGEIVIDAANGTVSESPSVTLLSDGGYAIAYVFDTYDDILTSRTKIWVNVYNADGTKRAEVRVDMPDSNVNDAVLPEIFATTGGGFRVMWQEDRSVLGFDRIVTRAFDRDGDALGPTRVANTNVDRFDQERPVSVTLANGSTITAWRSEASFELGTDLDANELRGTLTDRNGKILRSDFSMGLLEGTINEFGNSFGLGYDFTALASGGFVMSHLRVAEDMGFPDEDLRDALVLRYYDSRGNITRADRVVHLSEEYINETSIAQLDGGQIVVVWEQPGEGADIGEDIFGRILSADGRPISSVFEIGVDSDIYDSQESPVVRALAGGGFVVSYTSESIDNDNEGIAARIFGRATQGSDVLTVDVTRTMAGLDGNDRLTGNVAANLIWGNAGRDTLSGEGGADRLAGGQGNDRLRGGAGNDTVGGQQGADTLTGGSGGDQFVFDRGGADRVTDFGSSDVIALDNAVFAGLGPAGRLDSSDFKRLGQGIDANDRVIYELASGKLWYDGNGSGAGQRLLLGVLENRPTLTAADFLVI